MSESEWRAIEISTGYGANTQQPYVQLIQPPDVFIAQMSPESARELAQNLVQAAEAAEQDRFIVEFAQQQLEASFEEAAQLLHMLRECREEWQEVNHQKGQPNTGPA